MNYRNILQKGSLILKKSLILSSQFESELLLSLSLNKSRDKILLNLEENLTVKQIKKYIKLINRRKKKEPISSIFGNKFFWKYEFKVNKNVLAPRFETELMVEELLKIYKQQIERCQCLNGKGISTKRNFLISSRNRTGAL